MSLIDPYDLVRLIELDGTESGSWCVALQPEKAEEQVLWDLQEEFAVQIGSPPRILDAKNSTRHELIDSLHVPPGDVLIVTGLDEWDEESWRELDIDRSKLARNGAILLLLNPTGLVRLAQNAPNLRSWIGGHIFALTGDRALLTAEERIDRLQQLREKYGLTDARVTTMAETGNLPSDPDFVEWLVYLGRGDLV